MRYGCNIHTGRDTDPQGRRFRKKRFLRLYGRKFGIEAYNAVMDGRTGTSYRKYGGPLIRVVTAEEAGKTAVLERRAGML